MNRVHTKEISKNLRLRIADWHEAEKGHKSISKSVDVNVSAVRHAVYKWTRFCTVATFPTCGHYGKMIVRGKRRIPIEVKKNPGVPAKE